MAKKGKQNKSAKANEYLHYVQRKYNKRRAKNKIARKLHQIERRRAK